MIIHNITSMEVLAGSLESSLCGPNKVDGPGVTRLRQGGHLFDKILHGMLSWSKVTGFVRGPVILQGRGGQRERKIMLCNCLFLYYCCIVLF